MTSAARSRASISGSALVEFLRHLIRLGRFKFLAYSWLFYSLGVTAAICAGYRLDGARYLLGLSFGWCAHLMTHYCNEYFDLAADRANPSPTRWTGGSRVLVEGKLAPSVSLAVSVSLLIACVALALSMDGPARWLALSTIALGWFYTSPPLRLNYRGAGELTVTLVLNGLAPAGAFALQSGRLDPILWVLLLPSFLVQYARMLTMNLIDHEGDRRVDKRTAVVVLGPQRAVGLHATAQIAAYGSLIPALVSGLMPLAVVLSVALTLPLSIWQVSRLFSGAHRDAGRADSLAFWASSHSVLVMLSIYVGLLSDRWPFAAWSSLTPDRQLTLLLCCLPPAVFGLLVLAQIRMYRALPSPAARGA